MGRGNVSSVDELAAIIAEQDDRIAGLERVTHRHPTGALDQATADGRYVNVPGDSMTGTLNFGPTLVPFMTTYGDSSWMGFYSAGGSSRRGYIQGNAGGITINSDAGTTSIGPTTALQGALTFPGGHSLTNPAGDGWMRPSSNFYVAATLGCGVLAVGSGGAATSGYTATIAGANAISLTASNPYINAPSYIVMPGGLFVSGGTCYIAGPFQCRGGHYNDSGTYAPANRIMGSGANYSAGWTTGTQAHFEDTSGAQHAAICFYTGPTAPIIRAYGPFGERLDFLNNPNTAYIGINAAAFTVTSSERIKHDIAEVADDELLGTMGEVRTHRYEMNTPPMTMPVSSRFLDLNRRWVAHGHHPLTPTPRCYDDDAEPHDCNNPRHWCLGSPDHPCPIALNSGPRFGLIAEHLADHVPDAVSYGEDEKPEGYDVDQVAAMAFGGVGALLRLVEALTARVEELEQDRRYELGVAA